MQRFEFSVDIAAPVDRVWHVLTDVESWPQWTASMTDVRRLDSGPLAVGSAARIRQPQLLPAVWTVTEFVPPTTFTWISVSLGLTTTAIHELTAVSDGTTILHQVIDQIGLLAPILGPMAAGLTRRYVAMEAMGHKRHAEQDDS